MQKVKAGINYANWFYSNHNIGVENQRICIDKISSILGVDFDTALKIQYPVLSLYSANNTISLGQEVIHNLHKQISQQILNHVFGNKGFGNNTNHSEVINPNIKDIQTFIHKNYLSSHVLDYSGVKGSSIYPGDGISYCSKAVNEMINHVFKLSGDGLGSNALSGTKLLVFADSDLKGGDLFYLGHILKSFNFNFDGLFLQKNTITDDGMGYLLTGITSSDYQVSYNPVRYVSNVPVVQNINYLDLSNNQIGDNGAKVLAESIQKGALPGLRSLDISGNQVTITGEGYFAKAMQSFGVQDIMVTIKKYASTLGQQVIKPALKEFVLYAGKHGVDISHLATNKETIEYLKDGGIIVKNLAVGYAKCSYKMIEILFLDMTAPSLTIDYLVERSGKEVLKKGNFYVCVSMETYDAIVSPEGVDLAVQAVELLGD